MKNRRFVVNDHSFDAKTHIYFIHVISKSCMHTPYTHTCIHTHTHEYTLKLTLPFGSAPPQISKNSPPRARGSKAFGTPLHFWRERVSFGETQTPSRAFPVIFRSNHPKNNTDFVPRSPSSSAPVSNLKASPFLPFFPVPVEGPSPAPQSVPNPLSPPYVGDSAAAFRRGGGYVHGFLG